MPTGTYSLDDLIAVRFASAVSIGLDTIQATLQQDLADFAIIADGMVSELCEVGSDAQRIYGTSTAGTLTPVDEFGRAPTQKQVTGVMCGFPLDLFQYNLGWTRKFLQVATVGDLVQGQLDAQKAYLKGIYRAIRRALLNDGNYSFTDYLTKDKGQVLAVKRLVNADSAAIPDGPTGTTFDGASHTHYLPTAGATFLYTEAQAMIDHIVEHGHGDGVILAINYAQAATVKAFTGFAPLLQYGVVPGAGVTGYLSQGSMSPTLSLDNQMIGRFGGADVWTKPWLPDHYIAVYAAGDPRKPLYLRRRVPGLAVVATEESFPLRWQGYEAEFGVGVWTRTNGVCSFEDVGASWVDPTIA